jgi:hypothetical protein
VHGSFTWRDGEDRDAPEAELVERRVRQAVQLLRTIGTVRRMVE